jgi:hypothetical protein
VGKIQLLNIKVGGTYSYHWALKWKNVRLNKASLAEYVETRGTQEMHTQFWSRNLLKSVHLENQEGNKMDAGGEGLWQWEANGTKSGSRPNVGFGEMVGAMEPAESTGNYSACVKKVSY